MTLKSKVLDYQDQVFLFFILKNYALTVFTLKELEKKLEGQMCRKQMTIRLGKLYSMGYLIRASKKIKIWNFSGKHRRVFIYKLNKDKMCGPTGLFNY